MFGQRSMNGEPGDERLKTLLAQWEGIEPGAHFEAEVWRRIRSDSVVEPQRLTFFAFLRDGMASHPAWAAAAAAVLAIAVGALAAVSAPAPGHGRRLALDPPLHTHTVAGAYLAMTSGDVP